MQRCRGETSVFPPPPYSLTRFRGAPVKCPGRASEGYSQPLPLSPPAGVRAPAAYARLCPSLLLCVRYIRHRGRRRRRLLPRARRLRWRAVVACPSRPARIPIVRRRHMPSSAKRGCPRSWTRRARVRCATPQTALVINADRSHRRHICFVRFRILRFRCLLRFQTGV